MGRHPDGTTARTEWLKVRVTPEWMTNLVQSAIDAEESISEYVRKAVEQRAESAPAGDG